MIDKEYSAVEIREVVQKLFPHRKLVLSQFTFFNHAGVSRPTGNSFRRGRRCYRLVDILPIAVVLALKEQGIPLKNIETVPSLIQDNADTVFGLTSGCKISGYGNTVSLIIPGVLNENRALETMLSEDSPRNLLYWTFDISALTAQLRLIAIDEQEERIAIAA